MPGKKQEKEQPKKNTGKKNDNTVSKTEAGQDNEARRTNKERSSSEKDLQVKNKVTGADLDGPPY